MKPALFLTLFQASFFPSLIFCVWRALNDQRE
jgi:hypothetical protein